MEQGIKLYDYAKQVVANERPMDPVEFSAAIEKIYNYVKENKYTMLLCNDRKDFTIFKSEYTTPFKEESIADISETISNRGQLLILDKQEDNSYEIWIRDMQTGENFAYFLFDYSNAIVEV